MKNFILPSLLAADILNLEREITKIKATGIKHLHLDIMDNHYVPNLSFGPGLCQAIAKLDKALILDVHLMANQVDTLITSFAKAGASRIAIHPTTHLDRSLTLIKKYNCEAGVALNPGACVTDLTWVIDKIDFILIMSVNPGFGGQKFIPYIFKKIKFIKQTYPKIPLCIDGGVDLDNIRQLLDAGISQFVAGSTIFNSKNYATVIEQMQRIIT